MATVNLSKLNDIIIPTNNGDTYRGNEGDDTYILVSQESSLGCANDGRACARRAIYITIDVSDTALHCSVPR